jgi:hypothetical protein
VIFSVCDGIEQHEVMDGSEHRSRSHSHPASTAYSPTVDARFLGTGKRDGPSGSILGVSSEKQAYKVARKLLKEFALECIAKEAIRQNLPPSIRQKVQANKFREISKQTEDFSTHWAQFSAKGLVRVTDLEGYVKRKLVAAGDFKDLRKKIVSQSLVNINLKPDKL